MPWNRLARLSRPLPESCVFCANMKSKVRTLVQHSSLDASTHVATQAASIVQWKSSRSFMSQVLLPRRPLRTLLSKVLTYEVFSRQGKVIHCLQAGYSFHSSS